MKKNIYLSFLLVFIFSSSYFCEEIPVVETDQKKIEKYLSEVFDYNKSIKDFSATLFQSSMGGTPITAKYYQVNNEDGSVFSRTESKIAGENVVVIQNAGGTWSIQEGQAFKIGYFDSMKKRGSQYIFNSKKSKQVDGQNVTYSQELIKVKELAYQVVRIQTALSENAKKERIELMTKMMPKELMSKQRDSDLSRYIPYIQEFWFRNDDNFFYRTVSYNEKGKILSKLSYEDVKINCNLKNSLFEIDKKLKVVDTEKIFTK